MRASKSQNEYIRLRRALAAGLWVWAALVFSGCREAGPSFYVNVQDFPLYLKAGFDPSDTVTPDLQDGSWTALQQWTHVIPATLQLPGLPKRAFLSPFGKPPQEWTFLIPFTMEGEPPSLPGLFLAAIGDNWEIYLNGFRLRRELHLDDTGGIREHHSQRKVFFPLERSLLREGENLLAFRIIGDPTDVTVGLQYAVPYYLADYEYIIRENSEILEFILIGVYLLVGVYHFLIFALRRVERYHGFCGFFALGMGLYYFSRTRGIYYLIPDTLSVIKIEFFIAFLMLPALTAFTELLCRFRISLITKVYSGCMGFLAASQVFFPHPYGEDALIIFQVTGIPAVLWILVHHIFLSFRGELKSGKKFCIALWDTSPGNMLIGVSILLLTIGVDLFDALLLHYSIGFTRYSMIIFVLAMAVMLARLYSKLHNPAMNVPAAREDRSAFRERLFQERFLTRSEREVARLMIEGCTNGEIADKIFRSRATVEFHVTNIYRKFGIEGKTCGRAAFMALFIKSQNPGG
jgi:DNA-binding CsgD family transcriptional regulator